VTLKRIGIWTVLIILLGSIIAAITLYNDHECRAESWDDTWSVWGIGRRHSVEPISDLSSQLSSVGTALNHFKCGTKVKQVPEPDWSIWWPVLEVAKVFVARFVLDFVSMCW
jgi:hypothetical protein